MHINKFYKQWGAVSFTKIKINKIRNALFKCGNRVKGVAIVGMVVKRRFRASRGDYSVNVR